MPLLCIFAASAAFDALPGHPALRRLQYGSPSTSASASPSVSASCSPSISASWVPSPSPPPPPPGDYCGCPLGIAFPPTTIPFSLIAGNAGCVINYIECSSSKVSWGALTCSHFPQHTFFPPHLYHSHTHPFPPSPLSLLPHAHIGMLQSSRPSNPSPLLPFSGRATPLRAISPSPLSAWAPTLLPLLLPAALPPLPPRCFRLVA